MCHATVQSVNHLCHHFPFLEVVSHKHHNGLAAEHKVQHGGSTFQLLPQLLAEEVDVDQVLQGGLANHLNAQLLSGPAAGSIGSYEILSIHLILCALQVWQLTPVQGCRGFLACDGLRVGAVLRCCKSCAGHAQPCC